jgi:acyl dehydratase
MNDPLIGKTLAEFTYLVERCKIRELADAIGDPDPIYRDEEAAIREGYRDVIAPPTFGTCVNLWGGPSFSELIERLGMDPLRVLHAEQEYEYLAPIYPGDMLRTTIKVTDVYTKEGRSGKTRFIVLETTCYNQQGEKVLIGRSIPVELSREV